MVAFARNGATKTALLLADGGRANTVDRVSEMLSDGWRVVTMDPFCIGRSDPGPGQPPTSVGALFAMTTASVGQRPLGIQASQVRSVARWIAQQHAAGPVTVVGVGPRTSLMALVAAGLDETAIKNVQLHQALGSLKQAIEDNWSAMQYPELFCFGLLESFRYPTTGGACRSARSPVCGPERAGPARNAGTIVLVRTVGLPVGPRCQRRV